jgi:hypothetical protein
MSTLWNADSSPLILPFQSAKQHYLSLSSLKQIQGIDDVRLKQFFKSYYQKKQYSLSGYFHILSTLTFHQLSSLPSVIKWLDTYNYSIKLCPSQVKEMIQIGALAYSHPPIFDFYMSDFLAAGKKTKVIFVSMEISEQQEMIGLFKQLYNGSPKAHPNGYMMLFIPLLENSAPTTGVCSKILFNHEQYNGDADAFSIGGFQDLKAIITLWNGDKVSLHTPLKSLPASSGMSCPQLFNRVEPNSSGVVTMVTFQKQDCNKVLLCQKSLETEIRQVIADEEDEKIFISPEEGIWFGGVNKTRTGKM